MGTWRGPGGDLSCGFACGPYILTPVVGRMMAWLGLPTRHRGSRFEAKQCHSSEWEYTACPGWDVECRVTLVAEAARHSRPDLGDRRLPRVELRGVTRPLRPVGPLSLGLFDLSPTSPTRARVTFAPYLLSMLPSRRVHTLIQSHYPPSEAISRVTHRC